MKLHNHQRRDSQCHNRTHVLIYSRVGYSGGSHPMLWASFGWYTRIQSTSMYEGKIKLSQSIAPKLGEIPKLIIYQRSLIGYSTLQKDSTYHVHGLHRYRSPARKLNTSVWSHSGTVNGPRRLSIIHPGNISVVSGLVFEPIDGEASAASAVAFLLQNQSWPWLPMYQMYLVCDD